MNDIDKNEFSLPENLINQEDVIPSRAIFRKAVMGFATSIFTSIILWGSWNKIGLFEGISAWIIGLFVVAQLIYRMRLGIKFYKSKYIIRKKDTKIISVLFFFIAFVAGHLIGLSSIDFARTIWGKAVYQREHSVYREKSSLYEMPAHFLMGARKMDKSLISCSIS